MERRPRRCLPSPPSLPALAVLALMLAQVPDGLAAGQRAVEVECRPDGVAVELRGLSEASGLAASRRVPGRLWSHNDSKKPVLFALDTRGAVTGRIAVTGAALEDWEAVAVAPCPAGSCLYLADIGDNDGTRSRITIYRLPEPAGSEASIAVAEVFHGTYPDGAHDAEAFLATPDGLFIVTKGDGGAIRLYRFPAALRSGASHQLERVGKSRGDGRPANRDRVTDGAVSPDGRWVALRTNASVTFHHTADLIGGSWRQAGRVELARTGEVQGEGVAIGGDGTVYLAGEGGGKSRRGTFTRLACTFAR
jgi:hypothetical protein